MIRSYGRLHSGLFDLVRLDKLDSGPLCHRQLAPGCSPPCPTRRPNFRSSLDPCPRYCPHEAVTEAQSLVDCHLVFVANRVPLLPPRCPIGANHKIDIPPGFELQGPTWSTSHLGRNEVEVRGVGVVRPQVS